MPYSSVVSYIVVGGNTIQAVGTASLSLARAALDVTEIGKRNAYSIPGVGGASVAFDIFYHKDDHSVFTNAVLQATAGVATSIYFEANDVFTGNVNYTGVDIVSSVGDLVRASVSGVIVGQYTLNEVTSEPGPSETLPPEEIV